MSLLRNTVSISVYNPEWKIMFEVEKKLLAGIFGTVAVDLQHIGSTAVTGLSAKPIIDIALQLSLSPLPAPIADQLEEIHYHLRPGKFDDKHLVFAKGDAITTSHLLHVILPGSNKFQEFIRFRDYLIGNVDARTEYSEMKAHLAKIYANDRQAYTASKNDFIRRVREA